MAVLAMVAMSMVVTSIVVMPFAIVAHSIYKPFSMIARFFFARKPSSRFVILGTSGSYMVKDVATREFVAKNIPTMKSAKKILRVFESDEPNLEDK